MEDAGAFVDDPLVGQAVAASVSSLAGLPESAVSVALSLSRRLEQTSQDADEAALQQVTVDFSVQAEGRVARSAVASLQGASATDVAAAVEEELLAAGVAPGLYGNLRVLGLVVVDPWLEAAVEEDGGGGGSTASDLALTAAVGVGAGVLLSCVGICTGAAFLRMGQRRSPAKAEAQKPPGVPRAQPLEGDEDGSLEAAVPAEQLGAKGGDPGPDTAPPGAPGWGALANEVHAQPEIHVEVHAQPPCGDDESEVEEYDFFDRGIELSAPSATSRPCFQAAVSRHAPRGGRWSPRAAAPEAPVARPAARDEELAPLDANAEVLAPPKAEPVANQTLLDAVPDALAPLRAPRSEAADPRAAVLQWPARSARPKDPQAVRASPPSCSPRSDVSSGGGNVSIPDEWWDDEPLPVDLNELHVGAVPESARGSRFPRPPGGVPGARQQVPRPGLGDASGLRGDQGTIDGGWLARTGSSPRTNVDDQQLGGPRSTSSGTSGTWASMPMRSTSSGTSDDQARAPTSRAGATETLWQRQDYLEQAHFATTIRVAGDRAKPERVKGHKRTSEAGSPPDAAGGRGCPRMFNPVTGRLEHPPPGMPMHIDLKRS